MTNPKNDDEKRRDEVLKRMLATPPKPHESTKAPQLDKPGSHVKPAARKKDNEPSKSR